MSKNGQGKIFITGVVVGLVLLVLNAIEGWLSNGMYLTSEPLLWRNMSGNWWLYMLMYNLIIGLILSQVFSVIHRSFSDKGAGKGIQYGFCVWLVGNVPGILMTMLTMNVPFELSVVWLISGLINLLIAGVIIGSMIKPLEE